MPAVRLVQLRNVHSFLLIRLKWTYDGKLSERGIPNDMQQRSTARHQLGMLLLMVNAIMETPHQSLFKGLGDYYRICEKMLVEAFCGSRGKLRKILVGAEDYNFENENIQGCGERWDLYNPFLTSAC